MCLFANFIVNADNYVRLLQNKSIAGHIILVFFLFLNIILIFELTTKTFKHVCFFHLCIRISKEIKQINYSAFNADFAKLSESMFPAF